MGIAETIRFKIEKSLEKQSFSPEVLSVMKALLLGQRKEITKNTLANYTNAGVIHVLAISGLHLGILLMFINFISNPLLHVKNGKFVKVIIVVVILWSFAFISGLSASVARSATMFSFITIAKLFQKKTFSEYSIISSIFVLLLINPMDLFNIGFQLSYLAVFGIIWIYPLLFNLWTPKYFILMKLWQLTVVSISAQIAVLPLSIYYFHQFPMLFLISNLVIVSLLGFILISGILVILLSSVDALPEFIALSYDFIINKMNSFVQWISSFDQFVLKEISLNKLQTIIWYLIIIGCVRSLYRFKGRNFLFILIYSAFLQLSLIYEKYTTDKKDSLVIFHKTKQTIIGKQKGKEFTIYNNQKESNLTYLISPIKKNEDIKINYKNKLPDILRHKENIVLLINNSDFFAIEGLNKNVIVILTNSPKLNLDRFLQSNTPKMIIADGSNYRSYINKWQKTCKKQKTPFYSTEKNGAYILN
ncbi:ComEC/Rec2 family competence protein [Tenacibaculum sp. MAR_2009_124]|uniref:ComEC/Rec2 family competence protein n=1 Tax=Tenacibaculum sp. MAR_2009_124 TaxID=1250059 RepID=UPI000AB16F42|nr:ComEC/Rec2 family competence protein [Tenacibaculum sp. MAR_2009_124]